MSDHQTQSPSERDTLMRTVDALLTGERAMRVALAQSLGRPDAAPKWSALIRVASEQRTELTQALERLQRTA